MFWDEKIGKIWQKSCQKFDLQLHLTYFNLDTATHLQLAFTCNRKGLVEILNGTFAESRFLGFCYFILYNFQLEKPECQNLLHTSRESQNFHFDFVHGAILNTRVPLPHETALISIFRVLERKNRQKLTKKLPES